MTDYSELKRLAEAATRGPWSMQGDELYWHEGGYTKHLMETFDGSDICHDEEHPANLRFIAAANPAAVQELIAENERLKADSSSMRGSTKRMGEDASRMQRQLRKAERERDQLKVENESLRKGLLEASEQVATWGAYASEYFQEKHDLAGCVEKLHSAAMAKEARS